MKERNPSAVDILSEKDPRFAGLHGTRDTVARELREAGMGAAVQHTPVFKTVEEERLWSLGVLCVDSPKALLKAVFFVVENTFCLRGGREHEMLKLSQFQFGTERMIEFVVTCSNCTIANCLSIMETKDSISSLKRLNQDYVGPWFKKQHVGRNTLSKMVGSKHVLKEKQITV